MVFEKELGVALEAAEKAGSYLQEEYIRFEKIPNAPANISTEADRQSQEIIISHLITQFPRDAFCAEENSTGLENSPRTGPRLWIIDPIDGTRGFAKKNGEFSVMIGFVNRETVGVGVVLEPAKKRLTYASRGKGCWRWDHTDSSPVRCWSSKTNQLNAATLTQSHSKNKGFPSGPVAAVKPLQIVETYSAGIKLALVARGEADLYVNTYTEFHDWDICAGQILVEEAGGRVTGLRGETIQYGLEGAWQRAGLLATNGQLHEAALVKMKDLPGD